MKQVEELVVALEAKYKISIAQFLELYQENAPREEIALALGCQEWTIRTVASALNLRMAKKYRNSDYAYFLSRFGDKADAQLVEEVTELKEDLEQLSKDLVAKEVALVKAKREVAKYRRVSTKEDPLAEFDKALAGMVLPKVAPIPAISSNYKEHSQFILLSDLHFESIVTAGDAGKSNEYSWDIAEQRLAKVINSTIEAHRGESTLILMLGGDLLDGLIHSSLETSGKPLGQAVVDLALLLANHITTLSSMYNHIHIPCVSGNHERLTDFKRSHGQGYGFAYMLYNMIESLTASLVNISFNISTSGYSVFLIGDKLVGLMHGDHFKGPTSDVKILKTKEAFKQITGHQVNHVFSGHTHVPEARLFGAGDHWVVNGSLIGTNAYSITNGFTGVDWAQTIGSFLPDGSIENIRVVSA